MAHQGQMADPLGFVNLIEVEDMARKVLDKQAYDYYSGGAESMYTVNENRVSWSRIKLLPRMLRDVSKIDMSSNVLGIESSMPVWVAPMAMHGLAHEGREVATCSAAAQEGVPFTFSTVATSSFEEIAATGHPNRIYQLYVIKDRDVVRAWVQRAEALGFKAIMVTVDAQRLGRREADERNRFALPPHLQLRNLEYLSRDKTAQARDSQTGSGLTALFAKEVDDSLTWSFIPWLKTVTKLPIMVKGLLAPEDVRLAMELGVDAVVISNHGGRQLDYAPSAVEMLPAVMSVVAGRVPVIVDGGVRRGTDILKALALGASAVLLGRPVLYGLALGGVAGVLRVLRLLRDEFELAMALAGCASLSDITPALLLPGPNAFAWPTGSQGPSQGCACVCACSGSGRSQGGVGAGSQGAQRQQIARRATSGGLCTQAACGQCAAGHTCSTSHTCRAGHCHTCRAGHTVLVFRQHDYALVALSRL